jgi:tetratricopeptide (TPR) repeat protein
LLLSRVLRLAANALFEVGRVGESLKILHISHRVLKGVALGDYDDFRLEAASTNVDIAVLQEKLGKHKEAELSLQSALQVQVSLLGWNSLVVANTIDLQAAVARRDGRYDESASLLHRGLHIRLMIPESRHEDVLIAASFDGLGMTFREQGRHHEAFSLAWNALEIRSNALGKQHPDTMRSLEHVGTALFALGNYDEALAKFNEALLLSSTLYGERHFRCAQLFLHRGNTYLRLKKIDQALNSMNLAKTYLTECFGEEHVETARAKNSIACTLQRQGHAEESLRIFEQVLKLRLQKLGNRHKEVADTHYNMARLVMVYMHLCVRANITHTRGCEFKRSHSHIPLSTALATSSSC